MATTYKKSLLPFCPITKDSPKELLEEAFGQKAIIWTEDFIRESLIDLEVDLERELNKCFPTANVVAYATTTDYKLDGNYPVYGKIKFDRGYIECILRFEFVVNEIAFYFDDKIKLNLYVNGISCSKFELLRESRLTIENTFKDVNKG